MGKIKYNIKRVLTEFKKKYPTIAQPQLMISGSGFGSWYGSLCKKLYKEEIILKITDFYTKKSSFNSSV